MIPSIYRWIAVLGLLASPAAAASRPNVLLIMTDDQGYGDLSLHGNPVLRTPNLDRLARQGVRLDHFYVSPVCAPTRASLMTGRYNYRTRVVDTYRGRALMDPDEVTLAEHLRDAGYRTGIFGKWHLGDNAPMRAQDQGFETTLTHRGGGIGQPSDAPVEGGGSYFDPILWRNGDQFRARGYVSDVLTEAAIAFVREPSDRPFFAYLAFNCPHSPYQAPDAEYAAYRSEDLSPARFPGPGHPPTAVPDTDPIARSYAMIANIDSNVGRLLDRLDADGLARDTLVVFLTDNGPPMARYNAGLRGRKGTVYEGGIRVPCFVRWPAQLPSGSINATLAAHIDLMPTILAACGIEAGDQRLDGRNLLPILTGARPPSLDRGLYFQWHRGDSPEPGRAFAARNGRYKLVRAETPPGAVEPAPLELFDIESDPFEEQDLAASRPDLVDRLQADYQAWFHDVAATRGFDPPRIWVGTQAEDPVELTRQDWRSADADGQPDLVGHWEIDVKVAGPFEVSARVVPDPRPGRAILRCPPVERTTPVPAGATSVSFDGVELRPGPATFEIKIVREGQAAPSAPTHVTLRLR